MMAVLRSRAEHRALSDERLLTIARENLSRAVPLLDALGRRQEAQAVRKVLRDL